MSSDEDDYMSDKFLPQSSAGPGLIRNRVVQREVNMKRKKDSYDDERRVQHKSRKEMEKECLQVGLDTALSTQNKGFAMLAKMGYKQGQAIGKSAQGIVEPIGITVKTDRGGLGRTEALRQLKERRFEIRRKRMIARAGGEEFSTESYRKRMTQKAESRQIEIDLGKCQRACESLDIGAKITTPAMLWFWPIRKNPNDPIENNEDTLDEEKDSSEDEDEDEADQYEPTEQLEMLANYLRTTYLYCHWCGTQYNDEDDFSTSCPGPGKDDH